MTEKDSKDVRVGCGRYSWELQANPPYLAMGLHITIEAMQVLPSETSAAMFAWFKDMTYPWSSPQQAVQRMPGFESLQPVRHYLSRGA
jgi:hypothetical protein